MEVWWGCGGVVRVWRCGGGVVRCGGVVGVWGYKHIKSWLNLNVILECHFSTLMSYCLVLRSSNIIAKGRTTITPTESTVV